jgi:hypothetical protein
MHVATAILIFYLFGGFCSFLYAYGTSKELKGRGFNFVSGFFAWSIFYGLPTMVKENLPLFLRWVYLKLDIMRLDLLTYIEDIGRKRQ